MTAIALKNTTIGPWRLCRENIKTVGAQVFPEGRALTPKYQNHKLQVTTMPAMIILQNTPDHVIVMGFKKDIAPRGILRE